VRFRRTCGFMVYVRFTDANLLAHRGDLVKTTSYTILVLCYDAGVPPRACWATLPIYSSLCDGSPCLYRLLYSALLLSRPSTQCLKYVRFRHTAAATPPAARALAYGIHSSQVMKSGIRITNALFVCARAFCSVAYWTQHWDNNAIKRTGLVNKYYCYSSR